MNLIGYEVSADEHVIQYTDRFKRKAERMDGHVAVAAFNIQIFGKTKSGSEEVMDILSQVRHDT